MKQRLFDGESPAQVKRSAAGVHWKLFVDGASRNNPGLSGAGICIFKNDEKVEKIGYFLGIKTNNQAEYLALIIGLMHIRMSLKSDDTLTIISDSQLLIRQLTGHYRVRHDGIKKLYQAVLHLLHSVRYTAQHVLREENHIADALANEGIDQRIAIPVAMQHELLQYAIVI